MSKTFAPKRTAINLTSTKSVQVTATETFANPKLLPTSETLSLTTHTEFQFNGGNSDTVDNVYTGHYECTSSETVVASCKHPFSDRQFFLVQDGTSLYLQWMDSDGTSDLKTLTTTMTTTSNYYGMSLIAYSKDSGDFIVAGYAIPQTSTSNVYGFSYSSFSSTVGYGAVAISDISSAIDPSSLIGVVTGVQQDDDEYYYSWVAVVCAYDSGSKALVSYYGYDGVGSVDAVSMPLVDNGDTSSVHALSSSYLAVAGGRSVDYIPSFVLLDGDEEYPVFFTQSVISTGAFNISAIETMTSYRDLRIEDGKHTIAYADGTSLEIVERNSAEALIGVSTIEFSTTLSSTITDISSIEMDYIGELTVDYGYYSAGSWTSIQTVDTTSSDVIATYTDTFPSGTVATHIRVKKKTDAPVVTSIRFYAGAECVLDCTGGVCKAGNIESYDGIVDVPDDETESATFVLDNTVYEVYVYDNNIVSTYYFGGGGDFCLFVCDYISLNENSDIVGDTLYTSYKPLTISPIVVENNTNDYLNMGVICGSVGSDWHFFFTRIDENLERTDNKFTADITAVSATRGMYTDTLENSDSDTLITLTLTVLDASETTVSPYGVVVLGQGHKDFQRASSTKAKTVYKVQSGTHIFDKIQSTVISGSGNVSADIISDYVLDTSEQYDAYVETVNMLFDPTYQSQMASDTLVIAMIARAVSIHPTVLDWTMDGNYQMNENAGWYETGDDTETCDMDNTVVYASGSKQVVITSVEVDHRQGHSVRFKVEVGKQNKDGDDVYDDFKVLYVQVSPSGLFGIEGDEDA